jgi:hypothetical protein
MATADDFPRESRWDGVGLDCSFCRNERSSGWPNVDRPYCCGLHGISLRIEIRPDGYKGGEWLCRDFDGNGREMKSAARHLHAIRHSLRPAVLYGLGAERTLREIPFPQLGPCGAGHIEVREP